MPVSSFTATTRLAVLAVLLPFLFAGTVIKRGPGGGGSSGGGLEGTFEDFRTGAVRGLHYSTAEDCYALTNALFNWSGDIGDSTTYTDPTTAGGNAEYVDCTAVMAPHTACPGAGYRLRINVTADVMLAYDNTCDYGKVLFPIFDGFDHGIYVQQGCGIQQDGTQNNCPAMKAPRQNTLLDRVFVARGVKMMGERADTNAATDRQWTGVWFLNDRGDDGDAIDPNDDTTPLPRRTNYMGYDLNTGNDNSGSPNRRIIPATQWARGGELQDTFQSHTTICFNNALATTGTCNGDRSISCSNDGECSGFGGDCQGFVDAIGATITANGGSPVMVGGLTFIPGYVEDTDVSTSVQDTTFYISDVSANGCGTTGLEVTALGWPFDVRIFDSSIHTGGADFLVLDPNELTHGGYWNMTIAPANSRTYGWTAADVPVCDASFDGKIATIVDDDGSCTATGDTLDGGESTFSECKCDSGSWSVSGCGSAADPDNSIAGCEDNGTAINHAYLLDGESSGLVLAHAASTSGNPFLDGSGTGHIEMRNNIYIANSSRITDSGEITYSHSVVLGNRGLFGGNMFSLCFEPDIVGMHDFLFINNSGYDGAISTGPGHRCTIRDLEFRSGNDFDQYLFKIDGANGTLIENIQIVGGAGGLAQISFSDGSTSGGDLASSGKSLTLRNITWKGNNDVFSAYKGFIVFRDFVGTVDEGSIVGPFIVDNVHVDTVTGNECFIALDGQAPSSTTAARGDGDTVIDLVRQHLRVTNSSMFVDGSVQNTEQFLCVLDSYHIGQDRADDSTSIWRSRYRPYMSGNRLNDIPLPDWPYTQMSASEAPRCHPSLSGVVVALHDDGATHCAHTEGVLDAAGSPSNNPSVCICTNSGGTDSSGASNESLNDLDSSIVDDTFLSYTAFPDIVADSFSLVTDNSPALNCVDDASGNMSGDCTGTVDYRSGRVDVDWGGAFGNVQANYDFTFGNWEAHP